MSEESRSPWQALLKGNVTAPLKQLVATSPYAVFFLDAAVMICTPKTWVVCGWAGKMEENFIRNEQTLRVILKDGYKWSQSEKNQAALTDRLRDPNKKTEIYIVDPDSPYMEAVAAMDINKKGKPESQSSDCKQTINVLQTIRRSILKETDYDCAETNLFISYDSPPPCVVIVGDKTAELNLYYPQSAPRALLDRLPGLGSLLSIKGGMNSHAWAYAETAFAAIKQVAQNEPKRHLWYRELEANLENLRAGPG